MCKGCVSKDLVAKENVEPFMDQLVENFNSKWTWGTLLMTLSSSKAELKKHQRVWNVEMADIILEQRFHNSFMTCNSQSYEIRKTALASLLLLNDREERCRHKQIIHIKGVYKLSLTLKTIKKTMKDKKIDPTTVMTKDELLEFTTGLKGLLIK